MGRPQERQGRFVRSPQQGHTGWSQTEAFEHQTWGVCPGFLSPQVTWVRLPLGKGSGSSVCRVGIRATLKRVTGLCTCLSAVSHRALLYCHDESERSQRELPCPVGEAAQTNSGPLGRTGTTCPSCPSEASWVFWFVRLFAFL